MLHTFLARGSILFQIDNSFLPSEISEIKRAQVAWNRYISHPKCLLHLSPVSIDLDHSTHFPLYDEIFTIRGDISRPDSDTFTVIRGVDLDGVNTVKDIDINVNLLYTRKCSHTLYPFMLHEFGHVLGFKHNSNPASIMNITSIAPFCKRYKPYIYLPGIDIHLFYLQLGGKCQTL